MCANKTTDVAFLYLDEIYMDAELPPELQSTSLTGLLVTASTYPLFRERFFRLLPGFPKGAKRLNIDVHASDFFRDRPDSEHFAFYRGLVSLINELSCKVYRRAFGIDSPPPILRKQQSTYLKFCFRSILIAAAKSTDGTQIWPVMETDHSKAQDQNFAGYIRWMDHATTHLEMTGDGVKELIDENLMVDNANFGELHYVTKKSIIGSAVDCLAYLLHCRWLAERDYGLTPYKKKLAVIASYLDESLIDDDVVTYVSV